jgi:hypothetical protein
MRFLAPQGVFRTDEEKVEITELGMALAEGPRSLRYAALYLMETHYEPFGDLLGTVRTGEPAAERQHGERFLDWIARDLGRAELRQRTFGAVTSFLRGGMFDGYRLPPGAVVADIGGGDGSMIARTEPDWQALLCSAGLTLDRVVSTPSSFSFIEATVC